MINLRRALVIKLKEIYDRVSYQKASSDTLFPYATYYFPSPSFMVGDIEVLTLQIDVWDDGEETVEIETIADKFWKELNQYNYIDEDIQFTIYRETRFPVVITDSNLKVRELTFNLKYIDRRLF